MTMRKTKTEINLRFSFYIIKKLPINAPKAGHIFFKYARLFFFSSSGFTVLY